MSDTKSDITMLCMHIHQDPQYARYICEELERLRLENTRFLDEFSSMRRREICMYDHLRALEKENLELKGIVVWSEEQKKAEAQTAKEEV